MKYGTLIVEEDGPVGVVTLNRPEARNAINRQCREEIAASLHELESDPSIKVILIKGAGACFSAGADITEMQSVLGKSLAEKREHFYKVIETYRAFERASKPVVCAVHRYALGGGLWIALYSDLVVATEDAEFGASEIRIGIFPMGLAAAMVRRIALKKCFELMAFGDRFTASEGEKIGLVNRVVKREDLHKEAMNMAKTLAARSPAALRLGKDRFYRLAYMQEEEAVSYAADAAADATSTEDAREGIAAFLEKRPPQWREEGTSGNPR